MKIKKTLFITACVSALTAAIFSFAACSFTLGGDFEGDYEASDKENTVELFDGFFENTLANDNYTVSVKSNGDLFFTESVDGEKDETVYSNGSTTWSYKADGKLYFAFSNEDSSYYMEGKEYYDYGTTVYLVYFDRFKELPEDEISFSCKIHEEGYASENESESRSKSTMNIEITSDAGYITIEATSENGLVRTLKYNYFEEGDEEKDSRTDVKEFTFEYGNASVTLPDTSDWSLSSPEPIDENEEDV